MSTIFTSPSVRPLVSWSAVRATFLGVRTTLLGVRAARLGVRPALLVLLLLLGSRAEATKGELSYPRVATYTSFVGTMTPAELDTLAWHDVAFLRDGQTIINKIRQRNPDIRLFYDWMPQNIPNWNDGATWWYPDTTWCLSRRAQFYAQQNDWYLRDVNGNRIPEAAGWAANWTRYCPRGTYGTSRGLTYVEWLVQVVMPQLITSGEVWERWHAGSSSYDGLNLEILVDCVGSWGGQNYAQADPDRDGQPEGCDTDCELGGHQDSLSILYREMNEVFHEEILRIEEAGCLVILNAGTKRMGPSWRQDVSGVKIERWLSYHWPSFYSWWEAFYGLLSFMETEILGPGYKWAEDLCGTQGADSLEGWDCSILQVIPNASWAPEKVQRLKRWGLGTCLLGDGYFNFTYEDHQIRWLPEFDWDFGAPLGDFTKEVTVNEGYPDTMYVRLFSHGFTEVNPQERPLNGVPAQDARFGFWQTVQDLTATAEAPTTATVRFTAPHHQPTPVESMELRYAQVPITPDNWSQATSFSANPIQAAPGEPMTLTVTGLQPARTYYFALRNRTFGREEPGTSNVATAALPAGEGVPPSGVTDLTMTQAGETWLRLAWSAPGDDGSIGRAQAYRIRSRASQPILTESDWSRSVDAPGTYPAPAPPGSHEQFLLDGLHPGVTYGLAVRAVDDAGNLGPLSNPTTGTTLSVPPPPPPPHTGEYYTEMPDGPGGLRVEGTGPSWIELSWIAPKGGRQGGGAAAYLIRALPGRPVLSERDWDEALRPILSPPSPAPGGARQSFRFTELPPDSLFGFAVRTRNAAGRLGPLHRPVLGRTDPIGAPGRPAALQYKWSGDREELVLSWRPSSSPEIAGYHVYGEAPDGSWVRVTADPVPVTSFALSRPRAVSLRRLTVRAVSTDGAESPRTRAVDPWTERY